MRRKDREITDQEQLRSIIRNTETCYMGMCSDGQPYVVPMNFGYEGEYIYFHSALQGRKIDILKENPRVTLVFTSEAELQLTGELQTWTTRYKSVMAEGIAKLITDESEKQKGINIILSRYTEEITEFSSSVLGRVMIIKVKITNLTGKGNPNK